MEIYSKNWAKIIIIKKIINLIKWYYKYLMSLLSTLQKENYKKDERCFVN